MLVGMHIPAEGMLFPHGIAQFLATVPTVSLASTQGSVGPSWQPAAGAAAVVLGALIAGVIGLWSSRYAIKKQREMTELTLEQQRKTTERTLEQQWETTQELLRHQRAQLFNDRFATAADKLGHLAPATRLAGVYAAAGLADDWEGQRQTCIEVLCAYLRLPYETDPAASDYREGEREIRRTIIRVIRDHLRPDLGTVSWSNYRFSFEGATFDCGDLTRAHLTKDGLMTFHGARFVAGTFHFNNVCFEQARVWFTNVHFVGADVVFDGAQFRESLVTFKGAEHTAGKISLNNVAWSGKEISWGPLKAEIQPS
jgi:hypothetical protein